MADEPDWLKSSASPARTSSSAAPAPSSAGGGVEVDPNPPPYKTTIKSTVLVLNMGFMVFMAATGAIGMANADGIDDTGVIFVGIYMILFAAIEFIFELSQLCPNSALDTTMKKNFGFLYGTIGKGCFLLFMGILAFGLSPNGGQARQMALACGVLVSAWGVLLILLYLKFPRYFDKLEKYQP